MNRTNSFIQRDNYNSKEMNIFPPLGFSSKYAKNNTKIIMRQTSFNNKVVFNLKTSEKEGVMNKFCDSDIVLKYDFLKVPSSPKPNNNKKSHSVMTNHKKMRQQMRSRQRENFSRKS
jgi:hypothetical protein